MDFNSVVDRALSEHTGSGIMSKKSNGKYSTFLPVTNTGELGSAPEQIEKTAIGNMAKSYIQGRKDSPQQTLTFYVHRDNLRILREVKGKVVDFLRVFPDFSGVKYSGQVDFKYNDTALNSAEQGEISVTITIPEEAIDDCYDMIEDTVVYTSDIPEVITIDKNGTYSLNVVTNPADATIAVVSETTGVATANAVDKKVTITGVAEGSAVVEITATKEGFQAWKRTILVINKG